MLVDGFALPAHCFKPKMVPNTSGFGAKTAFLIRDLCVISGSLSSVIVIMDGAAVLACRTHVPHPASFIWKLKVGC